jgi:hypothetical protein
MGQVEAGHGHVNPAIHEGGNGLLGIVDALNDEGNFCLLGYGSPKVNGAAFPDIFLLIGTGGLAGHKANPYYRCRHVGPR